MKKVWKLLIVLLALALVVGGLYLYFFQIAPETTSSILVYWGNHAMDAGRYSRAVKLYEWAYSLDPGDAELALSLADSYSGAGNYTKAEYVLLTAKQENPDNLALYLALSQVFVAQDKLLDAQRMLDQVTIASVSEQLNALRPAAPVFSPEPGYYSDYISLDITAPSGTVYVSLDTQYPSSASGPYTTVTLPGGTTDVSAICVGDNGLVSTLSSASYTITGVIEEVTFQDSALDTYVRGLLYKSTDQKIMSNELWSLTELSVPDTVKDLSDLRYFAGLTSLTIANVQSSDLSFLAAMPALASLTLDGCALTTEQLSAVGGVTTLTQLHLSDCGLSSVSPLAALKDLTVLDLSENFIGDLSPLSSCVALTELNLFSNAVSDVSPLASNTALTKLTLSSNALASVDALSACGKMEELDVSNNALTSLSCIGSMPELRILQAAKNKLTEISASKACVKLEKLDISDNLLTSIDGLENILTLTYINIDYNDVKKLPTFSTKCSLQQFYAAHNFLEDITGLSNLPELNYVDIDYNNVSSVDCLLTCPLIIQINAFGTNVDDISKFKDTSIIVNYNPAM